MYLVHNVGLVEMSEVVLYNYIKNLQTEDLLV